MYADPITITIQGGSTTTFNRIPAPGGGAVGNFLANTSTNTLKNGLVIRHTQASGRDKADPNYTIARHNSLFFVSKYDATAKRWETMRVNITFEVPSSANWNRADIDEAIAKFRQFYSVTANVDKLLNNEA